MVNGSGRRQTLSINEEAKEWANCPVFKMAQIFGNEVQSLTGLVLGRVTESSIKRGRSLNGRMRFIRVQATNGRRYYGKLDPAGDGQCFLRIMRSYR